MRGRALALGGCVAAALFALAPTATGQGGPPPEMQVEPSVHEFGSVCVGVSSGQKTFTITNLDNQQDIPIDSIDRSGSGAGDFSPSGFPGGTIQENDTMKFGVSFTPSVSGLRSATYTVNRDDGGASESVTARGTGIDRRVAADRATVSFGEQRVGTRSPTQTLIVRNQGADTLHVSNVRRTGGSPGDFRLPGLQPLPFSIPRFDYVSLKVAFQPTAAGLRTSSIEITSDACGKPKLTVALVGTGVVPRVLVDPNPIDAGTSPQGTQGPPVAVTVANGGGASLKITAIQVIGTDAADFLLEGLPTMPATLAGSDSFVFNVRMTPSKTGARVAQLKILSDDPSTPEFSVDLSGTGGKASPSPTASATASASPSSSPTTTITSKPRALGAAPNDGLAIILVIVAVLLAFAGLVVIRRFIAVRDEED